VNSKEIEQWEVMEKRKVKDKVEEKV